MHVAPWYTRKDYLRMRELMDDGNEWPATFDAWESTAKAKLEELAARGVKISPVTIEPDRFVAYCTGMKFQQRGSRERSMFAIAIATAKGLH
jgi:hypothetical protein